MKALVVYFSRSGVTRAAAEHIAANALYQIEVEHVDSVSFDGAMVRELLS